MEHGERVRASGALLVESGLFCRDDLDRSLGRDAVWSGGVRQDDVTAALET